MFAGTALAMLAAALWGVVYATTQQLIKKIPALDLLAVTYAVGGLIAVPYLLWKHVLLEVLARDNKSELIFYLAAVLVAEACIMVSIALLGGSEASLIEVSYPIWTVTVLYLWQGEKPTWSTIAGGIMIAIGVTIIALAEDKRSKQQKGLTRSNPYDSEVGNGGVHASYGTAHG